MHIKAGKKPTGGHQQQKKKEKGMKKGEKKKRDNNLHSAEQHNQKLQPSNLSVKRRDPAAV